MFQEEFQAVCAAGEKKVKFLKKNPIGYFIAAFLAGMFVSFGSFAAFTLGSIIATGEISSFVKPIQAFTFAAALSFIIMAGGELFTGNNFVVASAALRKNITWGETIKLWVSCWIGNLVGSIFSVIAFQLTGVPKGAVGVYFAQIAETKISLEPIPLLVRAILCNILVCLAVWCGIKMKSESGKLIMIFWCIFIFMVCGFEHSVANMSILGVGLLNAEGTAITFGGCFYNIFLATVGNIIGGAVFLAFPYHMISR